MSLYNLVFSVQPLTIISSGLNELLKRGVPAEVVDRLRTLPHLQTQEDIDAFREFCEASPHKLVRGKFSIR